MMMKRTNNEEVNLAFHTVSRAMTCLFPARSPLASVYLSMLITLVPHSSPWPSIPSTLALFHSPLISLLS
jgi:hypothetical protein